MEKRMEKKDSAWSSRKEGKGGKKMEGKEKKRRRERRKRVVKKERRGWMGKKAKDGGDVEKERKG